MPTITSESVPWGVVAKFASLKLDAAQRGYTTGFSIRLRSPADRRSRPPSWWATVLIAGSIKEAGPQLGLTPTAPAQAPMYRERHG